MSTQKLLEMEAKTNNSENERYYRKRPLRNCSLNLKRKTFYTPLANTEKIEDYSLKAQPI